MTIATTADYRELTRDTYSSVEDVAAMLVRAEEIVVRRTHREWALGTYTENLRLYPNGLAYPSCTPVVSVSSPAGATTDGTSVANSGWAWPTINLDASPGPPMVSVIYVGGYGIGQFPEELVAVQCEIALYKLNPPQMSGVPAGAQQVRVSTKGQMIAGVRMGGLSALPPSIRATLRELQVRRV